MLALVSVLAVSALDVDQKACISKLDAHLKEHGVGCYFGSDDSRRAVLESFFQSILSHCDLQDCTCNPEDVAEASCDSFATASLIGYINIHSDSAPLNALYTNMTAIVSRLCIEETGQAGVPSELLLSPSFGACGADNVVSVHTGGIGAYIAVYAALFTLVMVESTERSRYTAVPTEETVAKPVTTGDTKQFL
jgi:hypothetical protein